MDPPVHRSALITSGPPLRKCFEATGCPRRTAHEAAWLCILTFAFRPSPPRTRRKCGHCSATTLPTSETKLSTLHALVYNLQRQSCASLQGRPAVAPQSWELGLHGREPCQASATAMRVRRPIHKTHQVQREDVKSWVLRPCSFNSLSPPSMGIMAPWIMSDLSDRR